MKLDQWVMFTIRDRYQDRRNRAVLGLFGWTTGSGPCRERPCGEQYHSFWVERREGDTLIDVYGERFELGEPDRFRNYPSDANGIVLNMVGWKAAMKTALGPPV